MSGVVARGNVRGSEWHGSTNTSIGRRTNAGNWDRLGHHCVRVSAADWRQDSRRHGRGRNLGRRLSSMVNSRGSCTGVQRRFWRLLGMAVSLCCWVRSSNGRVDQWSRGNSSCSVLDTSTSLVSGNSGSVGLASTVVGLDLGHQDRSTSGKTCHFARGERQFLGKGYL